MDLEDVKNIVDVIKEAATGDPIDDRKYVMEKVIQVSGILVHQRAC